MKNGFIFFITFLNLFFFINSVVQDWVVEDSSIDLFASSNTVTVSEYEKDKGNMYVKLTKEIKKYSNGAITYTQNLIVSKGYNDNVYIGPVNFDKIESFYKYGDDYIVCPKGKHQPHYFYNNQYSTLSLSDFRDNGDWELKCYHHGTGYFLVFYLMNGDTQFFYKSPITNSWTQKGLHQELYDFKLNNGTSYGEYYMAYLVKNGDWIKLKGAKYTFNKDGVFQNDCGGEVAIMPAAKYTRGCFENDYDHFYFLTYTNTSDFSCGYYDSLDRIDKSSVSQYENSIVKVSDSPLEFVDQVEIKDVKFMYNYKYAYYTIYNPTTGKTSYGIIDTKKNIVAFNTEEEIISFIPYSTTSMLAITASGARQNV